MGAIERVLANQHLLSPFAADNLNLDELSSDLDWRIVGRATEQMGRRGRRDLTVTQSMPSATAQDAVAERAALDWYFAQTADDADQVP